jgi:hypothetical protein
VCAETSGFQRSLAVNSRNSLWRRISRQSRAIVEARWWCRIIRFMMSLVGLADLACYFFRKTKVAINFSIEKKRCWCCARRSSLTSCALCCCLLSVNMIPDPGSRIEARGPRIRECFSDFFIQRATLRRDNPES